MKKIILIILGFFLLSLSILPSISAQKTNNWVLISNPNINILYYMRQKDISRKNISTTNIEIKQIIKDNSLSWVLGDYHKLIHKIQVDCYNEEIYISDVQVYKTPESVNYVQPLSDRKFRYIYKDGFAPSLKYFSMMYACGYR